MPLTYSTVFLFSSHIFITVDQFTLAFFDAMYAVYEVLVSLSRSLSHCSPNNIFVGRRLLLSCGKFTFWSWSIRFLCARHSIFSVFCGSVSLYPPSNRQ